MNGRTLRGGRLTRKGAAELLGVSVGTVRRLEGTVLHPVVDASGTHLFEVAEVRAAAEAGFGNALPSPAAPSDTPTVGAWQELARRVAGLERGFAELKQLVRVCK